nr:hypothetical protein [Miniphocaeibacter massiliensis]
MIISSKIPIFSVNIETIPPIFSFHPLLPNGLDATSKTFFETTGIVLLYSGVTNKKASKLSTSFHSFIHSSVTLSSCSESSL